MRSTSFASNTLSAIMVRTLACVNFICGTPFQLFKELSVQDPKNMRASQKYRGIPIAILNGNVMPKEAVR